MKAAAGTLLPPGSKPRLAASFGAFLAREGRALAPRVKARAVHSLALAGYPYTYERWLVAHAPSPAELARQRRLAETSANATSFHVVVVADGGAVASTLTSLRNQTWPRWSATVVGDQPHGGDRVGFVAREGRPVAAAIDAAIRDRADGGPGGRDELVVVVSGGDTLAANALFDIADEVWQNPALRLVCWDDDVRDDRGVPADPRFRPSWSPDLLLSANYLGRAFAVRAGDVLDHGGIRDDVGSEWAWDLLLRLDLRAEEVARITKVLEHLVWRDGEVGPHATTVVGDHLRRVGWPARARLEDGAVKLSWELDTWPRVSVMIPSRCNRPLLSRLLPSLVATDYPDLEVLIIDNSGHDPEKEEWYREHTKDLDARILWWDVEPFSYSAVNNEMARHATGDVLVLLNDDTDAVDPGWLRELAGWTSRDEIGTVGLQLLDGDGRIQHGGVVMGLNGLADHLFGGMAPHSSTILGSTDWIRDVSANTGACVAIRRDLYLELGGLDERLVLTGNDVALGLAAMRAGKRNVCSTGARVDHLESATRGTYVRPGDVHASYWHYQRWVVAGDPYWSPGLAVDRGVPRLRRPWDRTALQLLAPQVGRNFGVFRQQMSEPEAQMFADVCHADDAVVASIAERHAANAEPFEVRTVNWFLPDVENPYYGGINTILRVADLLARRHGVENRLIFIAAPNEGWFRSAVTSPFPALADAPILFHDGSNGERLDQLPEADVSIGTIWHSAYNVANFAGDRRKFFMVQDFDPMFYPAGTMYALCEETLRLGLYGICNSPTMGQIYRHRYGGTAHTFTPAVDPAVFHAHGRSERDPSDPLTIFLYARPGHWRNCWELAEGALVRLKERHGDRVRIVTAGSWSRPDDVGKGIAHHGLLEYAETGEVYRRSDIGMALTVSEHPSYLPLELMACGVPVVAFDLPAGYWVLRNGENCLLARRTVDSLFEQLDRLVVDGQLRGRLAAGAVAHVAEHHADWDAALAGIYPYLCDPDGRADR
jgi:GT2 family glycosyltransferase/glycosyltransferase involved in cell wall biosynthesis